MVSLLAPHSANILKLQHCTGYAGFRITCKNPTLYLSNHPYNVRTINFNDNTITLDYLEVVVGSKECPIITHDVILNTSYLNYTSENIMLQFFYNCTSYPDPDHSIKCLQYADMLSFMYKVGKISKLDLPAGCTSVVTVPVIAGPITKAAAGISALQYELKLTW